MKEFDYDQLFRELGIDVTPLPADYNPDLFGKKLIGARKDVNVSYSSSSIEYEYVIDSSYGK